MALFTNTMQTHLKDMLFSAQQHNTKHNYEEWKKGILSAQNNDIAGILHALKHAKSSLQVFNRKDGVYPNFCSKAVFNLHTNPYAMRRFTEASHASYASGIKPLSDRKARAQQAQFEAEANAALAAKREKKRQKQIKKLQEEALKAVTGDGDNGHSSEVALSSSLIMAEYHSLVSASGVSQSSSDRSDISDTAAPIHTTASKKSPRQPIDPFIVEQFPYSTKILDVLWAINPMGVAKAAALWQAEVCSISNPKYTQWENPFTFRPWQGGPEPAAAFKAAVRRHFKPSAFGEELYSVASQLAVQFQVPLEETFYPETLLAPEKEEREALTLVLESLCKASIHFDSYQRLSHSELRAKKETVWSHEHQANWDLPLHSYFNHDLCSPLLTQTQWQNFLLKKHEHVRYFYDIIKAKEPFELAFSTTDLYTSPDSSADAQSVLSLVAESDDLAVAEPLQQKTSLPGSMGSPPDFTQNKKWLQVSSKAILLLARDFDQAWEKAALEPSSVEAQSPQSSAGITQEVTQDDIVTPPSSVTLPEHPDHFYRRIILSLMYKQHPALAAALLDRWASKNPHHPQGLPFEASDFRNDHAVFDLFERSKVPAVTVGRWLATEGVKSESMARLSNDRLTHHERPHGFDMSPVNPVPELAALNQWSFLEWSLLYYPEATREACVFGASLNPHLEASLNTIYSDCGERYSNGSFPASFSHETTLVWLESCRLAEVIASTNLTQKTAPAASVLADDASSKDHLDHANAGRYASLLPSPAIKTGRRL